MIVTSWVIHFVTWAWSKSLAWEIQCGKSIRFHPPSPRKASFDSPCQEFSKSLSARQVLRSTTAVKTSRFRSPDWIPWVGQSLTTGIRRYSKRKRKSHGDHPDLQQQWWPNNFGVLWLFQLEKPWLEGVERCIRSESKVHRFDDQCGNHSGFWESTWFISFQGLQATHIA